MERKLGYLYTLKRITNPFGPSGLAQYGQDLGRELGESKLPFKKTELLTLRALDLFRTAVLIAGIAGAFLNDKPLLAIIPPILYSALGLMEMSTVYARMEQTGNNH